MEKDLILLLAGAAFLVLIRIIWLYCVTWKWNRMKEAFYEYRSAYQAPVLSMYTREACDRIQLKPWIWAKVWFWGAAEDCYDSKGNARTWFEIVDYWYQNRK